MVEWSHPVSLTSSPLPHGPHAWHELPNPATTPSELRDHALSPSALDALAIAQQLVELREADSRRSTYDSASSSPDVEDDARPPPAARTVLAAPVFHHPVTLMDLQMSSVLQQYALKRVHLIGTGPLPFLTPPPAALAVLPSPPPAAKPAVSSPLPPAPSMAAKLVPKRALDASPWVARSWALDKAEKPHAKRARALSRRPKTDTSRAPPPPFGVHMVCMAANLAKEGGCGCRMAHKPLMEHNGVGGVGEWHVVTQPHFNCAGGSFRPAVFVTACDAACGCACHGEDSRVDAADCSCKGTWRRATAEEWVKTTTAPTANSWKDRRVERERALEARGGGGSTDPSSPSD